MKILNAKASRIGKAAKAALRALRRAARGVHTENRRLGLPIIVYEKGKIVRARRP